MPETIKHDRKLTVIGEGFLEMGDYAAFGLAINTIHKGHLAIAFVRDDPDGSQWLSGLYRKVEDA